MPAVSSFMRLLALTWILLCACGAQSGPAAPVRAERIEPTAEPSDPELDAPPVCGVGRDDSPERTSAARACADGNGAECAALGLLLGYGEAGPRDLTGSRCAHLRACDLDVMHSCTIASAYFTEGMGGPPDGVRARALAERACASGEEEAPCAILASALVDGRGGPADRDRGRELFRQGCERSAYPMSCYGWARFLFEGDGVPQDVVRARELFEQTCAEEDLEGCTALGAVLLVGRGGPADPERGRQLLDWACEQGLGFACHSLGAAFRDGRGLDRDPTEARRHFERGCALGDARSCEAR